MQSTTPTIAAMRIQSVFRGHQVRQEKEVRELYIKALKDIATVLAYYPTANIVNGKAAGRYDRVLNAIRGMAKTVGMLGYMTSCLTTGIVNCGELAILAAIRLRYDPDFKRLLGDKVEVAVYSLEKSNCLSHAVVVVGDPADRKTSFILDPWIRGVNLFPVTGYRKYNISGMERDHGFFGTVEEYFAFLAKHPTEYATAEYTLKKDTQIGEQQNASYEELIYKGILLYEKFYVGKPPRVEDSDFLEGISILISSLISVIDSIETLNSFLSYFIDADLPEVLDLFLKHPFLQEETPETSFEHLALKTRLFCVLKLLKRKPNKELINQQNFRGDTIMHSVVSYICSHGNSTCSFTPFETLLEEPSCDLKIKNRDGRTPLELALIGYCGKETPDSRLIFQYLLEDSRCLDLVNDQSNENADTLLHVAIRQFQFSQDTKNIENIVELMKKKNMPFDLKNKQGKTPIEFAKESSSESDFIRIFGDLVQ